MNRLIFGTFFIASIPAFGHQPQLHSTSNNITFSENKGQVHDQDYNPRPDVLYGVMAGDMAVHIKRNGVSYQLYQVNKWKEETDPVTLHKTKMIGEQIISRVDLTWLNANQNISTSNDSELEGYNNYYLPSCPDGVLYAKSFRAITIGNIYNGINLNYYGKEGNLKHDYIVAPHADYKQIQIRVTGAEVVLNDDGTLLLATPFGKIQEGAPIVYQKGRNIEARWVVENNILSFEIGDYNANEELVIDPITRLWGTYYGGNSDDRGKQCMSDNAGNVYLSGLSQSASGTIIATTGSHQTTLNNFSDAFLAKFDSNGQRLWATYYGGEYGDGADNCAVDNLGNVYLSGQTSSSLAIASLGSHDNSFGGNGDAFLAKFNASGVRIWATYYGGSGNEYYSYCKVDVNDNVYLFGSTSTTGGTIIATSNSHQPNYGGGTRDAYVVKFDSSGLRLWGTYYGGTFNDNFGLGAVDSLGNVYCAGTTNSSSGIATGLGHQTTLAGQSDAFLVKFNSSGSRQWATYYGGTSAENGQSCTITTANDVMFIGTTSSTLSTIFCTANCHQPVYGGGGEDSFIAEFSANGSRKWGTYYGGIGSEGISNCTIDEAGNLYFSGITSTSSGTAIASIGSFQASYGGGSYDCYLLKMDPLGSRLWGTYYGGSGEDVVFNCTYTDGILYFSGYTNSTSGIAANGHQNTFGGGVSDGFLVKIDACEIAPQLGSITGNTSICSDATPSYSVNSLQSALSYTWALPTGWTGTSTISTISTQPGASGVLSVTAMNSCGTSSPQTLSVTVHPLPNLTFAANLSTICVGESAVLTASGAVNYSVNGASSTFTTIVSPGLTSTYTLEGVSAFGCSSSQTLTITVDACTYLKRTEEVELDIYPNPAIENIIVESEQLGIIEIINCEGKIILRAPCDIGQNQFELKGLAQGIYYVKIKGSKLRGSKFIKI